MAEGVPTNNQRGRRSGPCRLWGGLRQGPLYSPNRLVSQSTMLKERSVQGCRRAKHKTYSPVDDHWVILSSSKLVIFITLCQQFWSNLEIFKMEIQNALLSNFLIYTPHCHLILSKYKYCGLVNWCFVSTESQKCTSVLKTKRAI